MEYVLGIGMYQKTFQIDTCSGFMIGKLEIAFSNALFPLSRITVNLCHFTMNHSVSMISNIGQSTAFLTYDYFVRSNEIIITKLLIC